jgi:hypothetical protein
MPAYLLTFIGSPCDTGAHAVRRSYEQNAWILCKHPTFATGKSANFKSNRNDGQIEYGLCDLGRDLLGSRG